jgi:hypothetical protein
MATPRTAGSHKQKLESEPDCSSCSVSWCCFFDTTDSHEATNQHDCLLVTRLSMYVTSLHLVYPSTSTSGRRSAPLSRYCLPVSRDACRSTYDDKRASSVPWIVWSAVMFLTHAARLCTSHHRARRQLEGLKICRRDHPQPSWYSTDLIYRIKPVHASGQVSGGVR